jgi:hypothetical protein
VPPEAAGGEPEPLPMFGQLWVELEPELEFEVELPEPDPVLPDPEPVPLELEPEPDVVDVSDVADKLDGADVVELVPLLPVELDVVAASATSAPPARRPEVNAPTASAFRRRIFMGCAPFVSVMSRPSRAGTAETAPRT